MLWLKAFHIIGVVTWFAALFYLPRLFIYHTLADDKPSIERFKVMEHKLYYYIMMPSFIVTSVFGLWLLFGYSYFYLETMFWLDIKLLLVVFLIIYHFYCGHFVKVFKNDKNTHNDKFYRIFNELPTIILIAVVILAVVKPF